MIEADSSSSFAIGSQGKMNKVIERMKEEAAKLGANGILIEGLGAQAAGSVGTATATSTGTSAYGTGISGNIYMKAGRGVAIFVPDAK